MLTCLYWISYQRTIFFYYSIFIFSEAPLKFLHSNSVLLGPTFEGSLCAVRPRQWPRLERFSNHAVLICEPFSLTKRDQSVATVQSLFHPTPATYCILAKGQYCSFLRFPYLSWPSMGIMRHLYPAPAPVSYCSKQGKVGFNLREQCPAGFFLDIQPVMSFLPVSVLYCTASHHSLILSLGNVGEWDSSLVPGYFVVWGGGGVVSEWRGQCHLQLLFKVLGSLNDFRMETQLQKK